VKALIALALVLWMGLCLGTAFAAEPPCPPKRYYCWQVKLAVEMFGAPAVRDKARKCGWPEWKIAEAERCLP
jgi:hypothetical protein